jgi:hypothetical protein
LILFTKYISAHLLILNSKLFKSENLRRVRNLSYKSFTLITIILLIVISSASATANLEILKYAEDGSTILGEDSAGYKWMEQNLPVKGDGRTHYYLQGPVFEAKWSEVHPELAYVESTGGYQL